jgi:hypothetical protein
MIYDGKEYLSDMFCQILNSFHKNLTLCYKLFEYFLKNEINIYFLKIYQNNLQKHKNCKYVNIYI